jgi:hypothetical protein
MANQNNMGGALLAFQCKISGRLAAAGTRKPDCSSHQWNTQAQLRAGALLRPRLTKAAH